jgi:hypothetical protein
MILLPPWANGPFELLLHAEGHLRGGEDFDRRIALISFDNAIEVAIATYLTLHPSLRGDRTYEKIEVEKWLKDYHTKLDFLETELASRAIEWPVKRDYIVWAHQHRNEQYHGGNKGTPEKRCLSVIRQAAVWIFGLLFDVADVDEQLEQAIADSASAPARRRDTACDRAIDGEYGMIEIGDEVFYTSEALFAIDYEAYREIGTRLSASATVPSDSDKEPKA